MGYAEDLKNALAGNPNVERNRRRRERKRLEAKKAAVIAAEGQARHNIPKWRSWNNADKRRVRDALIKKPRKAMIGK